MGSEGCAPGREAASAPAAQARFSASSCVATLEQRDEEAGGEGIARGRPVDRLDHRWCRPCDLLAVVEQHRALGTEREGDEAVPARSDSSS